MVNASEVPGQFIWNWNAGADTSSQGRKMCSACSSCQQARVKCSGGNPCRRCSTRDLSCTYSPSMRKGRLKASSNNSNKKRQRESTITTISSAPSPPHDNSSTTSSRTSPSAQTTPGKVLNFDTNNAFGSYEGSPFDMSIDAMFDGEDPMMAPSHKSSMSGSVAPMSLDVGDFLTDLSFASNMPPGHAELTPVSLYSNPSQPSPPSAEECVCFWDHQGYMSRLEGIMSEKYPSTLDQILSLCRDCFTHTLKYLVCERCCAECSRLINVSLMLQRIVGLLCNICKNGQTYVNSQPDLRLRLGTFQLSDDEELMHKKLLLTQLVKRSSGVVQDFSTTLRNYREKKMLASAKFGLTESGLLNLKWLLDTARNLETRLKLILELLDAPDWPCSSMHLDKLQA